MIFLSLASKNTATEGVASWRQCNSLAHRSGSRGTQCMDVTVSKESDCPSEGTDPVTNQWRVTPAEVDWLDLCMPTNNKQQEGRCWRAVHWGRQSRDQQPLVAVPLEACVCVWPQRPLFFIPWPCPPSIRSSIWAFLQAALVLCSLWGKHRSRPPPHTLSWHESPGRAAASPVWQKASCHKGRALTATGNIPQPRRGPSALWHTAVSFRLKTAVLAFEEVVSLRAVTCALKTPPAWLVPHTGAGDSRASAVWQCVCCAYQVRFPQPAPPILSSPCSNLSLHPIISCLSFSPGFLYIPFLLHLLFSILLFFCVLLSVPSLWSPSLALVLMHFMLRAKRI